jgi:hypothetical protein
VRRRGDREQEAVEWNSEVPMRDECWERPSVKKLLAYEKEVSEGFAKAAWRSCADTLS